MMFVAAAANVRASIFQLEQKSQWTVKAMAGNIIPGNSTFDIFQKALMPF